MTNKFRHIIYFVIMFITTLVSAAFANSVNHWLEIPFIILTIGFAVLFMITAGNNLSNIEKH